VALVQAPRANAPGAAAEGPYTLAPAQLAGWQAGFGVLQNKTTIPSALSASFAQHGHCTPSSNPTQQQPACGAGGPAAVQTHKCHNRNVPYQPCRALLLLPGSRSSREKDWPVHVALRRLPTAACASSTCSAAGWLPHMQTRHRATLIYQAYADVRMVNAHHIASIHTSFTSLAPRFQQWLPSGARHHH